MNNDYKFFETLAQENKTKAMAAAMMEAQHKVLNEEEAYDKYACYDGSTMTMESCNDEEFKDRSSGPIDDRMYKDEVTYAEELTNYTYKCFVAF